MTSQGQADQVRVVCVVLVCVRVGWAARAKTKQANRGVCCLCVCWQRGRGGGIGATQGWQMRCGRRDADAGCRLPAIMNPSLPRSAGTGNRTKAVKGHKGMN
ncbi:hypothetical protein GQ53DRAFT_108854 [Thozetella sp. PMI_491]|nr:hypothetical protein GQ53DRAFT_108854 [Thozetella sp. PMI_491]